jgi:hypothetical protein
MRSRGSEKPEQVTADAAHDILAELRKTNALLQKLVTELEAEGPAEKLGKMLDGRTSKSKRK